MNSTAVEMDRLEDEMLAGEVSDEMLEASAGLQMDVYTLNQSTWGMCC